MSNYDAIITRLQNVRKHPNADRLYTALAAGYSVIVTSEYRENDLGILIPAGAQISREFGIALNLFRKHPETGDKMGGYLDPKGRVEMLKLQQVLSEGIFLSAKTLSTVGIDLSNYREGQTLSSFPNFENFVSKYESTAQRNFKKKASTKPEFHGFAEHYDTSQFRQNALLLSKKTGELWVTEKIHGTSGRTGRIPKSKWIRRFVKRVPTWMKRFTRYEVVTGSRRKVINTTSENHADHYRRLIHDYFAPLLNKGEIIYYEIAGFTESGSPIMHRHSTKKLKKLFGEDDAKRVKEKYGNLITYSYGCSPDGPLLGKKTDHWRPPRFRVFIYRITQDGIELPMSEVQKRALKLFVPGLVDFVPVIQKREVQGLEKNSIEFLQEMTELTRGDSTVDSSHPREGVCIRIDETNNPGKSYKHKGGLFCTLEGIMSNDENFIDSEDIS